MSKSTAWQAGLDPALVRRLHRRPGIVEGTIAQRIFAWVSYFSHRAEAFLDLLRQRGRVGSLRASEVPIVHARWMDGPETTRSVHTTALGPAPSAETGGRESAPVVVTVALQIARPPEDELRRSAPEDREIPRATPEVVPATRAVESAPRPIDIATPAIDIAIEVPAVEPRGPTPPVTDPRILPTGGAPDLQKTRPARARGAGAAAAEVIHLPPARRVSRGRHEDARASAGAPAGSPVSTIAAPAEKLSPSRPRGEVRPRVEATTVRPAEHPVTVVRRSTSSPARTESSPSSVIVPATRRVAAGTLGRDAERARVVLARAPAQLASSGALSAPVAARPRAAFHPPRVGPAPIETARNPARAPSTIVHASLPAPAEAPRGPAAPRGARPIIGSPMVEDTPPPLRADEAPASAAPSPVQEDGPRRRPPRRDLDVDALVEKVERRILKNLAVERERRRGAG